MTKTTFGAGAITKKTPSWANWMFRITFIITSAITIFIIGTNLFEENIKYEIMLALKAIDAAIYGFSRLFGIEIDNHKNRNHD